MEFALVIYLINLLSKINEIAVILFFLILVSLVLIAPWVMFDIDKEVIETIKRVVKPFIFVVSFLAVICIFVPSEKTMYSMLAAYGVQSVSENPDVQQIAGNSLKVLDKAMKEYLDEDSN